MSPSPSTPRPPAETGELMSLDFTSFAAPPPPPPPLPAAPLVAPVVAPLAPNELPPLDFESVAIPAVAPAPAKPQPSPAAAAPVPRAAAAAGVANAARVAGVAQAAPAAAAPPPAPAAPSIKSASLAGTLNSRVRDPLKQIFAVAERTPLRLDLARIAAVDDEGCALLAAALRSLRRDRPLARLAGATHLAGLLCGLTVQQQRQHEPAWLLLAELQIWLGLPAAFEETAIGYAITFEVSPPSWEDTPTGRCDN